MEHRTGLRVTLHAGYPMGVLTVVGLDQSGWEVVVHSCSPSTRRQREANLCALEVSLVYTARLYTQCVHLHSVFIYTAHSRTARAVLGNPVTKGTRSVEIKDLQCKKGCAPFSSQPAVWLHGHASTSRSIGNEMSRVDTSQLPVFFAENVG